ncbi:MAG: endolytic transglycosylase MltG [Halieaceae bacterium]
MKRLLMLILLVAVVAGLCALEMKKRFETELSVPQEGYTLNVVAGDSLRSVSAQLVADGVFEFPYVLRAYGRWTGLDQSIKRGEYLLKPGLTPVTLLALLQSGRVVSYAVTLPEGITLSKAIAILADTDVLAAELTGADDPRIAQLIAPLELPEGLFLPETYRFERGDSDWQVLQRAYAELQKVLAQEWQERAPELPYETPYEALIMASIIERETGVPSERPEIAGVFVRRLQKRMRLQTDPTVIYGLGEAFDGNLRRKHLADAGNPYNSYRHHGLPPSPIALAGRAAINAALHPAAGTTLFFVAKGDGSHQFSTTLEEHERAVRKYQLKRRQDYRSTPEK